MTENSIHLRDETVRRLSSFKKNSDDTYDDLINRLLDNAEDDLSLGDVEEIEKGLRDIADRRTISQEELFAKYGIRS